MRARSLVAPSVLSALLAMLSLPALAQPLEVASGDDLHAWQALELQRLSGAEAVAAYRGFLERFAASPLSEVAWGRLVALQADEVWLTDASGRQALEQVREAWLRHQARLRRLGPDAPPERARDPQS